jgi:hypothetical protein
MAFSDWASTLLTQSKYKILHGWESVKNGSWGPLAHISSKFGENGEFRQWLSTQNQESQRISQERAALEQQYQQLKTGYPQMSHEQRAAEMSRVTWQRPSIFRVAYTHPAVQLPLSLATKPLKVFAHALWGTGNPAPAHVTQGSNTMLLALAIVYHFAKLFLITPTLYYLIWINFFMILFVIFFIFDSSERNGDNYRILISLALVFEILLPYLTTLPALHGLDFLHLYLANGLIVLTWIYYTAWRGKDITYGLSKWLRWLILIFWLGVLFYFIGTSMVEFSDIELDTAGADRFYAAGLMTDKAIDGWKMLFNGVYDGFSNFHAVFSMRMKQATGEYYYGVVEENEKEPLGVYLENIKASQNEFEEYYPVTVYATLSARTLDDAIHVNVGCYAGQEKNTISGTVYPDETFTVENLQQEELDCSFDQLPEGTNKVTYNVSFNFQTIGYLKRYFADRDAITAATRQEIDLLDEYQITDKDPVAHYTNGPVAIGMGPEQALIGVSETYTVKPRLALTLDSAHGWGGKIASLEEVVLLIPDAMSLDTAQCTDSDWEEYTIDDCVESELAYETQLNKECAGDSSCIEEQCTTQLTGYNAYTLDVAKDAYKDIEEFITISCRLNVDDVSGLLGATPIATHYFYVKTRYNYEIVDDISVKVAEAEDARASSISGEDVTTSSVGSSVPTFSAGEEDDALQYIFYHYRDALFSAADASSVPVCTLASIIAQTSGADPRYYDDGRMGLFGLTQPLIVQAAAGLGLGDDYSSYKYDAPTNIRMGAWQLQQLSSSDISERAALYFSKLYGLSSDTEEAEYYATKVANYNKICGKLGLDDSKQKSESNADALLIEGSVSYDYSSLNEGSSQAVTLASSAGKDLKIAFVQTAHTVATAYLMYDATFLDTIALNSVARWHTFDDYPAQIFFDTTNSEIKYRSLSSFISNSPQLLEDTPTALVEGVLYVTYDSGLLGGALEFSFANNPNNPDDLDDFCTIQWHQDIAYGTCAEDGLPGFIVRNLLTVESAYGVLGTDYAKVQIEWNTQEQLDGLEE